MGYGSMYTWHAQCAGRCSIEANASETGWKLHEHVFHDIGNLGQFRLICLPLALILSVIDICHGSLIHLPCMLMCFHYLRLKLVSMLFPIQCHRSSTHEVILEKASLLIFLPLWPRPHWFPQALHMLIDYPRILPASPQLMCLPHQLGRTHPFIHRLHLALSTYLAKWEGQGLSTTGASLITNSWRSSSCKQYQTYIQKWCKFCHKWQISMLCHTAVHLVNFEYCKICISTHIWYPINGTMKNWLGVL